VPNPNFRLCQVWHNRQFSTFRYVRPDISDNSRLRHVWHNWKFSTSGYVRPDITGKFSTFGYVRPDITRKFSTFGYVRSDITKNSRLPQVWLNQRNWRNRNFWVGVNTSQYLNVTRWSVRLLQFLVRGNVLIIDECMLRDVYVRPRRLHPCCSPVDNALECGPDGGQLVRADFLRRERCKLWVLPAYDRTARKAQQEEIRARKIRNDDYDSASMSRCVIKWIQIRSGRITETRVQLGEHGATPCGSGVGSFFFQRRKSSSEIGPHSSQRGKKNDPTLEELSWRRKTTLTPEKLLYKNGIEPDEGCPVGKNSSVG
jgi:hypothetical protein